MEKNSNKFQFQFRISLLELERERCDNGSVERKIIKNGGGREKNIIFCDSKWLSLVHFVAITLARAQAGAISYENAQIQFSIHIPHTSFK